MFRDRDLLRMSEKELEKVRGRDIGMVFQDPMSSLNPVWSVGTQLADIIRRHTGLGRREAAARAVRCLTDVGVNAPEQRLRQYPFQLSGGLRQRILIAAALACEPSLVIADEPTTALDVSVQAQIIELLVKLKASKGFSLVLVTHDLGVAARLCDRVLVMYGGKVMETGPTVEILQHPRHPYTSALIASAFIDAARPDALRPISGTPPSVGDLPPGCPFEPRCTRAVSVCKVPIPLVREREDHDVACVRPV